MTFLTIVINDIEQECAKEFFISIFNILGLSLKAGAKNGGLIGIGISIWKLEIFLTFKHWKLNVTTHKIKED